MRQTRKTQQRILDAAKADGTLDTLLFYMVSDIGGGSDIPAAVNETIPVVRVGPDPAVSAHWAHLMLEIAKHYSPKLLLRTEITAVDILDDAGVAWIEFGDVDLVCPGCAAVGDSCVCVPNVWVVEGCQGGTFEKQD